MFSSVKKFFINLIIFLIIIILLSVSIILFLFSYILSQLPSLDVVKNINLGSSTQIYDRTGKILLYEIGLRNYPIEYKDIPQKIILATLAAEDDNFFKHKGISLRGILRSIILNIKSKSLSYGGSTISQQLARNLFLTNEKSFIRKIKEIILAFELERTFSKEEILTRYLNSINYGAGNIGIKAASDFYFNKDISSLSWSETVILASIPKSPTYYTPIYQENLQRLKERRDFILNRLLNLGWIKEEDYYQAIKEPILLSQKKYYKIAAPHFVIEIRKILEKNYPNINLETAGLKVISTLNYNYQKIAEEIVYKKALENEKKYGAKNAALMMIDSKTGEVLAMVGSRNFFDESIQGQVNMTTSYRQPGSAFKPISYLTLFQLGYPIETIVFDTPTNFGSYEKPYAPKNFDKKYRGPVNLKTALSQSLNIPSVKVFYLAGPERVIENAKKMGISNIKNYEHYGLSLVLGTAEVRMIDLLKAYNVLANDGYYTDFTLILKIINNKNEVLFEYKPNKIKIIDSQSVRMVNDILKDYNARRGLFSASLPLTKIDDYEIAIKTGTTQFYRDAWAIGYTPNFVIGVWAGNTDGKTIKEGLSVLLTLPVWHEFTSQIIKNYPKTKFLSPMPVKINKPMLNGEWFSDYGIHDILFYVDKNNPLGPINKNPYKDPQFYKWEEGVRWWLENSESLTDDY
jgi:1A family penicillin-binding protein